MPHPDFPRRNGPFVRLWLGESVSQVGSWISVLAVPLTAIYLLHASPLQWARWLRRFHPTVSWGCSQEVGLTASLDGR